MAGGGFCCCSGDSANQSGAEGIREKLAKR